MQWAKWPRPMDAVSPSPETPSGRRERFATTAPVATGGMRPWQALKAQDPALKYAGVFEEQPMPDIFARRRGSTPVSWRAFTMPAVMASWPHPGQSVDFDPL